jgi:uncharacterized membrane protein YcaP (DUF421 family)
LLNIEPDGQLSVVEEAELGRLTGSTCSRRASSDRIRALRLELPIQQAGLTVVGEDQPLACTDVTCSVSRP